MYCLKIKFYTCTKQAHILTHITSSGNVGKFIYDFIQCWRDLCLTQGATDMSNKVIHFILINWL